MARQKFTATNFLLRWLAALALVLATFNPTGYSYVHWVSEPVGDYLPLKVLLGLLLAILYTIFLRATWRSIGGAGVALALAFFGAMVWSLFYYEVLTLGQTTVMTYVALVLLASVMAVGLSWSHIRRRLSGQMDMDDVAE
jgi:hypothetical protein